MSRKLTIEYCQEIAESKNSKCLSNIYIGYNDPLEWQCEKGHKWKASLHNIKFNIKNKMWCKICFDNRSRLSIDEAKQIAKNNGGECLSTEYKNTSEKLIWKCGDCEFEWKTSLSSVKHSNSWCPQCASIKYTQEEVKDVVNKKGGTLLSEYKNARTKIKIRCKFLHEFETYFSRINQDKYGWCSECSKSISERICRECFEQIFNKRFPTIRPNWLKSEITGRNLELDGFCEELNLAFEHQGEQHYKETFFKIGEEFEKTKTNDKLKLELCNKAGVKLIIIPALHKITKLKDLKNFIKEECVRLEVNIPENYDNIVIDYDKIYTNIPVREENGKYFQTNNKHTLEEVEKLIKLKNKNAKCLSEYYNHSLIRIDCSNSHIYETNFKSLASGRWCYECWDDNRKITYEEVQEIVKEKFNGICLSGEYKSMTDPLIFMCEKSHTFSIPFRDIRYNDRFCKQCRLDKEFEEIKKIATDRGGILLSTEYKNFEEDMIWFCGKHKFEMPLGRVKSGSWCQICFRNSTKISLDTLKLVAVEKGGICMMSEIEYENNYKNMDTDILWKCVEGHLFHRSYKNVKYDKMWCKQCRSKENKKTQI